MIAESDNLFDTFSKDVGGAVDAAQAEKTKGTAKSDEPSKPVYLGALPDAAEADESTGEGAGDTADVPEDQYVDAHEDAPETKSHRGKEEDSIIITDLDAGKTQQVRLGEIESIIGETGYNTWCNTRLMTIAEENDDEDEGNSMSGVLAKRGHRFLHNWNARFFVYEPERDPPLMYFDSEHNARVKQETLSGNLLGGGGSSASGGGCRGSFYVLEVRRKNSYPAHEHGFQLCVIETRGSQCIPGSNTVLHLSASSEMEREDWLQCFEGGIKSALQRPIPHQFGDPPATPSKGTPSKGTPSKGAGSNSPLPTRAGGGNISDSEATTLAHKMAECEMVQVKDRGFFMNLFPLCFLGREAVAWMVAAGHARSQVDAVRLGNAMIHAGAIKHVNDSCTFENSYQFYQYTFLMEGEGKGGKDNGSDRRGELMGGKSKTLPMKLGIDDFNLLRVLGKVTLSHALSHALSLHHLASSHPLILSCRIV
jgi:hypothetical protein